MNDLEIVSSNITITFDDESANLSQPQRSTALSNKISSILSTSYIDAETKEAFAILDERKIQNTPEARRRLRIDAQKEVIDCNGSIIRDFGRVSDVCLFLIT
jgi:conserved oligomeric Golgi complex subunit 6